MTTAVLWSPNLNQPVEPFSRDGPIALTQCLEHGAGPCDVEPVCPTRRGWNRLNDAVKRAFSEVSLAELAQPYSILPQPEPIRFGAESRDATNR